MTNPPRLYIFHPLFDLAPPFRIAIPLCRSKLAYSNSPLPKYHSRNAAPGVPTPPPQVTRFGSALLSLLIFCSPLAGQAVNGTLLGTVAGPTGTTVLGANLTATDQDTHSLRNTVNNASANDTMPDLPPAPTPSPSPHRDSRRSFAQISRDPRCRDRCPLPYRPLNPLSRHPQTCGLNQTTIPNRYSPSPLPISGATSAKSAYYIALDGLRAVAVIMVFFQHYGAGKAFLFGYPVHFYIGHFWSLCVEEQLYLM